MKIGVVFPQTESSPDPGALREYVEAVEDIGYRHIAFYDHVLGATPDRPGGWRGPYTEKDLFHEVFVVLGYIAAFTARVELVTEVVVLPQRQTALVAKQAAEIDILSAGRLRLGVGLGWNRVEMEALGEDFRSRGRRIEEQVAVLRRLWSEPVVEFDGEFHHLSKVGINPLPKRQIPIWMGGTADAAKRRIARLADGWMMNTPTEADPVAALEQMRALLADAGRDPSTFGIEARVGLGKGVDLAAALAQEWRQRGVSHLAVNTMRAGLEWPSGHIDALRQLHQAIHPGGSGEG
jgi:probable F420-dependent oxidoreductase